MQPQPDRPPTRRVPDRRTPTDSRRWAGLPYEVRVVDPNATEKPM